MKKRPSAWIAVTRIALWLPAVAIVWMQLSSYDTLITRVVALPALLVVFGVWAVAGLARIQVGKTWPHTLGATLVLLSVMTYDLPKCVMFAAVRSKMDALADEVEHGRTVRSSFQVGTARVQSAEQWNGMTCFWTEPVGGDHVGYCCLREGDPADQFSEWSIANLGGGWYFIVED